MDPKGADAVLAVFSESSPEVAKANIDVTQDLHQQVCRSGQEDHGDERQMTIAQVDRVEWLPPVIHRVTTLDLPVQPWPWPFARGAARGHRRAFRGEAAREAETLERPRPARAQSGLRRRAFQRRLLRDRFRKLPGLARLGLSRPRRVQRLRHGRAALCRRRVRDGRNGPHTANAGRIYFPSGTPDLDDIRDGAVDIPGSVVRELEEETGLKPGDYRSDAHWHCVFTGPAVAMIRLLHVDMPGEALRARIEANLALQAHAGIVGYPSGARAARSDTMRCRALSPRSSKRSFRPNPDVRAMPAS